MASPITSSTALQPDSKKTMPATIPPLHNFVKLTSNISIYTPDASPPAITAAGTKPSTQDPTTILFCAWLNAHPRHIAKFLAHYQHRYPAARIILVRINTQQFIFESEAKRKQDMEPVVAALLAGPPTTRGAATDAEDRLLVHVCSSGGGKRLDPALCVWPPGAAGGGRQAILVGIHPVLHEHGSAEYGDHLHGALHTAGA
ncbi:hypothetical protein BP5796_08216 [Coleophoma crateriformis]|uniref:Uncharacterized protein n=1 Tax=Coleophoma crateriformis TaxID=565419 RepID=A0A3D8RDT2_9HELO|nr:hypothetical protein BP5796_08216 [Coleophoma crateriformis]